MASNNGAFDLSDLDNDTQERLAGMADEHDVAPEHVATTAFLVIINPDNSVQISPDANYDVTLQRMANPNDIMLGLSLGLSSIQASQTAGAVQGMMMQAAQAAQQARAAQGESSQILQGLGDLRGGLR